MGSEMCIRDSPKKVDQLFKALKHHDRRAFSSGQDVDYLTPIVADGDTGHGGLTAVMKLTQLMVEAGAAGVHFEDQSVFRVFCLRSLRRRRRGAVDAINARLRGTPSPRLTLLFTGPPARRSAATWAARSSCPCASTPTA